MAEDYWGLPPRIWGDIKADIEALEAAVEQLQEDVETLADPETYLVGLPNWADDATLTLQGNLEWGSKNPAQASSGEITAGTETSIRSHSPADIVSYIQQHGGGGGLTTQLNSETTITIGAGTDGEHHVLTSDSAITLTLDANAPVGTESAFTPAGAGAVSVAVEAGAGYWVPGDDFGGSPATAGYTLTGYGYFICVRNTDNASAEWLFVGASNLAASIAGALTAASTLAVTSTSAFTGATTHTGGIDCNDPATFDDNITMDGSSKTFAFGGNVAVNNAASVVTSVSGTLTASSHNGRVLVTSGNIEVPTTLVGFHATVKAGGAHTITFNGTVTGAATTGQVCSFVVQSASVIVITPWTTPQTLS